MSLANSSQRGCSGYAWRRIVDGQPSGRSRVSKALGNAPCGRKRMRESTGEMEEVEELGTNKRDAHVSYDKHLATPGHAV